MKYAQLITGLLIGTALGGSVVASTGTTVGSTEEIKNIVREVIKNEPQLIVDSVQNMQQKQTDQRKEASNEALKDPAIKAQVMDAAHSAFAGPKDAKHTVVEFFDYNCPACHAMFTQLDKLVKERKDVKVVFKEFPIFGETSDTNSKYGLAIWHLYPEKYYDFHAKMMKSSGRSTKATEDIIKSLKLDLAKLQEEIKNPKYAEMLAANRAIGEKLHVQGTPTIIVGDNYVPHGMSYDELVKLIGN